MKKHEIDSMEAVQVGEAYEEGISSLCRSRKDITEETFRKQIGFNWHRLQACLSLAAEKKPMPWETWLETPWDMEWKNKPIAHWVDGFKGFAATNPLKTSDQPMWEVKCPPTRWQRFKAFLTKEVF